MHAMRDSLFVFLDDSGNFDFSANGTRHFVLAAVTTTDPIASSTPLQILKYRLLEDGKDIECFHASPDKQHIRDKVISKITRLSNIQYHLVYGEKKHAPKATQSPAALYAVFGKALLLKILGDRTVGHFSRIVIIFDKVLVKKDQEAFLKAVKPLLKRVATPYLIYFHKTAADFNGQIADYGAWAKYVSLERNEKRPIAELCSVLKTDENIFEE